MGGKGIAALEQNKYFTEASTDGNDGIARKHIKQRYFTRASMNLKKDMC